MSSKPAIERKLAINLLNTLGLKYAINPPIAIYQKREIGK
jgi:hypothetical protein